MNCLELGARFIECIKRPHTPIDNKKDKIKCKPEFDAYTDCAKQMVPPILILNMERNIRYTFVE